MVANPDKFHIMFLGSSIKNNNVTFIVENKHIKSTNEEKLICGTYLNWELPLHTNLILQNALTILNNLCNTASNRLRAWTKIRKFLSQSK